MATKKSKNSPSKFKGTRRKSINLYPQIEDWQKMKRDIYHLIDNYYKYSMKKKFLIVLLFIVCSKAFPQAQRWDSYVFATNPDSTLSPVPGVYYPLYGINAATATICNSPANAVPCTNYATTYTGADGLTPCSPTGSTLTRPTGTACFSVSDQLGNIGAWIKTGSYQYTITTQYGSVGPFSITIPISAGPFAPLQNNVTTIQSGTVLTSAIISSACNGTTPGLIIMTPGTITASTLLTFPSNCYLAGSGQNQTTLSVSSGSAIGAALDLNGDNNSQIGSFTLSCAQLATACQNGIRVRYSTNIKLLDLTISGGGYGTGTNPRSQIYTENDDNIIADKIRFINSGGVYTWVNGFKGLPSTRLSLSHIIDENNLAVISLSLFNCQWCKVTNSYINENNQTDSSTQDGYGIMYYSTGSGSTSTQFTLTICTGSGTLTCTVPLDGSSNTQLPVGTSFRVQTVGITGGTGTLNGTWDATLLTSTTFQISGAGNTAGASFGSATVFYPTTNDAIDTVLIKNTAGSAIYLQGCQYCSVDHWNIENTAIQEVGSSLPTGCIGINSGYSLAPSAYGVEVGSGTCNGSGQNGIDFANTIDLSISGAITINSAALSGIRGYGGTNNNSQFDVGGQVTIDNSGYCFRNVSSSTNTGSISFTCSNFTTAGIFPGSNSQIFRNIVMNTSSYLPCIDDFQTGTVYENVKCNGGEDVFAGINQKVTGGGVYNVPTNQAVSVLGATHLLLSDFWIDTSQSGIGIVNNGATQSSDIAIKNLHMVNSGPHAAFFDQAPGALTITTNGTTTLAISATGTAIAPGMGIGDYGTGGNSDIPSGTTISSCPLSGTLCACGAGCSVTLSQSATGSHTNEAGLLQAALASNVKLWDSDIGGSFSSCPTTNQALLIYGMQGLDIERVNLSCWGGVFGLIDLRGQTGQIIGTTIFGGTVTGGASSLAAVYLPGGILGSAANTYVSGLICTGTLTNCFYDHGVGTGNVFNNFTNVLNGNTNSFTNTTVTVQGEFTVSLTPAAATVSTCTEQTFTVTGIQTGQSISVTPPSNMGVHLWIGSTRVSAANTAAIAFCADATGGTPPSGNYKIIAR